MANYFVAKAADGGSDANNGTSVLTPKLTIAAGRALMSGGDTLYIRRGTYNEAISSIPGGTSWATATTIIAYQGEIVTVNGSGNGNAVLISGTSEKFIILDGLKLTNPDSGANGLAVVSGAHHVRFIRGEIYNIGRSGIAAHGPSGVFPFSTFVEIISSSIHDTALADGATAGHGIYLSADDNLVDMCTLYNNPKWGVHIYEGDTLQEANRNVVRRSLFYNNGAVDGGGITLSTGLDNWAYNNVVYNCGDPASWGGIRADARSFRVMNNTVYNCRPYGFISQGAAQNGFLQNNIIYSNTVNFSNAGTNLTQSGNLTFTTDPLFIDAGNGQLGLLAGSPAINIGVDLSAYFTTDFGGNTRPVGGVFDAGAYEFGSIPAPPAVTGASRRLIAADSFAGGVQIALGGNWQQLNTAASTMYKTAGGQVGASPASSSDTGAARWVVDSFTADQYASLEYVSTTATADGSSFIGVCARASGDVNGSHDMYGVSVYVVTGVGTFTNLFKIVNGTFTQLASRADITWAAQDRIEIECIGTSIYACRSGGVVLSAIDTDLTTGNPGVLGAGTLDSLGDNWEGGNLNDTSSSVPAHKGRRFTFFKVRG